MPSWSKTSLSKTHFYDHISLSLSLSSSLAGQTLSLSGCGQRGYLSSCVWCVAVISTYFFLTHRKSGETLQLILQRDSTTKTSRPPALSSSSSSSSYHRDTHTLPRSHRPHSPPTPTHPSTHTFTQPSSTSSISYGTLSQDHLPLRSSLSAQGSHYSSLSHLPRERKLSGPAMSASTDVLSQPTNLSTFEYKLQV